MSAVQLNLASLWCSRMSKSSRRSSSMSTAMKSAAVNIARAHLMQPMRTNSAPLTHQQCSSASGSPPTSSKISCEAGHAAGSSHMQRTVSLPQSARSTAALSRGSATGVDAMISSLLQAQTQQTPQQMPPPRRQLQPQRRRPSRLMRRSPMPARTFPPALLAAQQAAAAAAAGPGPAFGPGASRGGGVSRPILRSKSATSIGALASAASAPAGLRLKQPGTRRRASPSAVAALAAACMASGQKAPLATAASAPHSSWTAASAGSWKPFSSGGFEIAPPTPQQLQAAAPGVGPAAEPAAAHQTAEVAGGAEPWLQGISPDMRLPASAWLCIAAGGNAPAKPSGRKRSQSHSALYHSTRRSSSGPMPVSEVAPQGDETQLRRRSHSHGAISGPAADTATVGARSIAACPKLGELLAVLRASGGPSGGQSTLGFSSIKTMSAPCVNGQRRCPVQSPFAQQDGAGDAAAQPAGDQHAAQQARAVPARLPTGNRTALVEQSSLTCASAPSAAQLLPPAADCAPLTADALSAVDGVAVCSGSKPASQRLPTVTVNVSAWVVGPAVSPFAAADMQAAFTDDSSSQPTSSEGGWMPAFSASGGKPLATPFLGSEARGSGVRSSGSRLSQRGTALAEDFAACRQDSEPLPLPGEVFGDVHAAKPAAASTDAPSLPPPPRTQHRGNHQPFIHSPFMQTCRSMPMPRVMPSRPPRLNSSDAFNMPLLADGCGAEGTQRTAHDGGSPGSGGGGSDSGSGGSCLAVVVADAVGRQPAASGIGGQADAGEAGGCEAFTSWPMRPKTADSALLAFSHPMASAPSQAARAEVWVSI